MARAVLSGPTDMLAGSGAMLRGGSDILAGVSELPLPTSLTSVAKIPLPSDTAIASNSSLAVQAIVDQSNASGALAAGANAAPFLNVGVFSTLYFVVKPEQPLIRVKVTEASSALEAAIGDAGVPLPASAIPQGDTDSTACLYVPGEVRGSGLKGVYYEFTGLYAPTAQQVTDGYTFQTRQITRMIDADNNPGQMFDYYYQFGASYDNPASDPYAVPNQSKGAMMYYFWGASAIGANPAFITHCMLPQDLRRGYCNHPLGMLVSNCNPGSKYPGIPSRSDGTLPGYPFQEGDWFRIPANAIMPNNLSPVGEVIWRTAQKYGIIIVDKTLSCLAFRAVPEVASLLVGPTQSIDGRDWTAWPFQNFPWASLELTVAGSLNEHHPRRNNAVGTGIGAMADWQVWLDPSQMTGVNDGATVNRQPDYSGKGRDAFAYNAAPIYKTNIVNGKPVIRFDTASSQGQTFAALDLADFTVFIVQQSSGDCIHIGSPSNFCAYSQLVRLGDLGAGQQFLFADDSGGYVDVRSSLVSVPRTNWSIIEVVRSGSTVSWFENGTAKGTGTLGPGGAAGYTRFSQVMNVPVVSVYSTGDLGDVLISKSALNASVRSNVRMALGAKYGITVI